ncbi:MAG: hypothetical protein K2N64_07240 [Anaeroplasmataceae bacterium]|nr:hypothetical protein [Anaeroplasmataceae bacterium]
MKKNKERSILNLNTLYLAYHLNKVVFFLFGIILILWGIVLFLNTGYPIQMDSYVVSFKSYHNFYFEQSIFFLQLIDGVLVAFLVGSELSSLDLFDPMFVPNVSRNKIIISKILANSILLVIMQIFQSLLLFLIACIVFPYYSFKFNDLALIAYIFLPQLELFLAGEFISMIFHTYFIPILIFILHIIFILLSKIEKVYPILALFIPQIQFTAEQFYLEGNLWIYLEICILFIGGMFLLFQKKDISNL